MEWIRSISAIGLIRHRAGILGNACHRGSGAVAVLCGTLTSLKSWRWRGPTAEHRGRPK